MNVKEFNYKGKKIVYRTKGAGPLVVLLHGFGEDGTVWKQQFELFPNRQLVVPDLPGSGGSEVIDDMSMEGMADCVYALVIHLGRPTGERRAILIGHSMGGYITLAFAEKYPKALNAFGLFHSTAFADNDAKRETRRRGIEVMRTKGAEAFLKTFVPNLYSPASKEEGPALIEEHLVAVRNVEAEALVTYFEAMMERPDRTEVLRHTGLPVLFVMGKHDVAVPVEDGLKQCHLPQNAYIHLLQNSGHMGMLEEAEAANKILTEFVTTVENLA